MKTLPIAINPDQTITTLSHADKLKIFLKPGPNTYIYLFLHDAEGVNKSLNQTLTRSINTSLTAPAVIPLINHTFTRKEEMTGPVLKK